MSSLLVHEPAASGSTFWLGKEKRFNIRSPPDIASNTSVIGFCGVNNFIFTNNETEIPDMVAHEVKLGDSLYGIEVVLQVQKSIDGFSRTFVYLNTFFVAEAIHKGGSLVFRRNCSLKSMGDISTIIQWSAEELC